MAFAPEIIKSIDWPVIYKQYKELDLSERKFNAQKFVPYFKKQFGDYEILCIRTVIKYLKRLEVYGGTERTDSVDYISKLRWNAVYDESVQSSYNNISKFYQDKYKDRYSYSFFYFRLRQICIEREGGNQGIQEQKIVPVLQLDNFTKNDTTGGMQDISTASTSSISSEKTIVVSSGENTISHKTTTPEYSIALILNHLRRMEKQKCIQIYHKEQSQQFQSHTT